VVWSVTPRFATWISSPTNILFTSNLLSSSSTCIELGSGISGIVALTLGAKIAQFTATDQDYAMKLLRQNIASNLDAVFPATKTAGRNKQKSQPRNSNLGRIKTDTLDWETDSTSTLTPVDLVIACDCIYNTDAEKPTLCVIAQQLRAHDVFETWLKSFHRLFHTWQVPDRYLVEGLKENSGFVVHIGIVR
jgi:hypothetical protein